MNQTQTPQTTEPVRFYMEARSTSEYGDSPAYAKLNVTPGLLAQIKELSGLCESHNLCSVHVDGSPDFWGPKGSEDEFRLRDGELVVTKDGFWFTARPKHADYDIETSYVDVPSFLEDVAKAAPGDALYEDNGDSLKEVVDEDEATSEAADLEQ
jgi:hypothetical protein